MKNVLLLLEGDEFSFVQELKKLIPFDSQIFVKMVIESKIDLLQLVNDRNIDYVICNNTRILKSLVDWFAEEAKSKSVSVSNYAGSVFKVFGKKCLVLPTLKSLFAAPHGKFIISRYLRKFEDTKNEFMSLPNIDWKKLDGLTSQEDHDSAINLFSKATLISIDIETSLPTVDLNGVDEHISKGLAFFGYTVNSKGTKTKKRGWLMPKIDMVGFTAIFLKDGKYASFTIVIDLDSDKSYNTIKALCENPVTKTMQRGQYDCAYLMRFGIAPANYMFDTYNLSHSWYIELKKDLGTIAAFHFDNMIYWKDESGENRHFYCAKDCHVTAWATINFLRTMPAWAKKNFSLNFWLKFPNISASLTGVKVDLDIRKSVRKQFSEAVAAKKAELEEMTWIGFNPSSSKDVELLMKGTLYKNAKGTDKKEMQKYREKHPLYKVLADNIQKCRELGKALSTYIDASLFEDRLLYELDECGTDSTRFSSKASSFWCGTQIQNIPKIAKKFITADNGMFLGSIDNSQSESRSTAYITGDKTLIDTVETAKDFHTRNVSLFFGYPEHVLWKYKAENPEFYNKLRNTGKRVNHGANYNMGADVLVDTMGTKAVLEAGKLLNFPSFMTARGIATRLLAAFDKAYPTVRGEYQQRVIREVKETSMLTLANGYTRYCFRDPSKNKLDLNSYVSFKPQGLPAQMINKAYYKTWYDLQIKQGKVFILAQIHDEIFFEYSVENESIVYETMAEYMREPQETEYGTLIIPNDWKQRGKVWLDLKD